MLTGGISWYLSSQVKEVSNRWREGKAEKQELRWFNIYGKALCGSPHFPFLQPFIISPQCKKCIGKKVFLGPHEFLSFFLSFFFLRYTIWFIFGHAHGMKNFQAQRLNPSHSSCNAEPPGNAFMNFYTVSSFMQIPLKWVMNAIVKYDSPSPKGK